MARAVGARTRVAGALEGTYGTAETSGFIYLPFVSWGLSQGTPLLADDALGFGADPLPPELDVNDVSGTVSVPLDVSSVGFWLSLIFGEATPSGADPYTHVFTSNGWDLPSATFEVQQPDAGHYPLIAGGQASGFTISHRPGGQVMTMSVPMVAKSETLDTETNAGTPTALAYNRFSPRAVGFNRNGSALGNVLSLDLTYSNGLEAVRTVASDGNIAGADRGKGSLTCAMTVRFTNGALMTQATGEAEEDYALVCSAGSHSLTLAMPRGFLPIPKREVSGPGGIDVTFEAQFAQQSNGNPMLTATLVNSVASY